MGNPALEERVSIEEIKTTIRVLKQQIKENRDLIDSVWDAYRAGAISPIEKEFEEIEDFCELEEEVCINYGLELSRAFITTESELIRYVYKNAHKNYWEEEVKSNLDAIGFLQKSAA